MTDQINVRENQSIYIYILIYFSRTSLFLPQAYFTNYFTNFYTPYLSEFSFSTSVIPYPLLPYFPIFREIPFLSPSIFMDYIPATYWELIFFSF